MLYRNSQKAAVIPTIFSQGAIILFEGNVNLFCDTRHNLRWRDKDMLLSAIWRPAYKTHAPFHRLGGDSVYTKG
jgi:hypothetical protein